jgi:hypothetical protein
MNKSIDLHSLEECRDSALDVLTKRVDLYCKNKSIESPKDIINSLLVRNYRARLACDLVDGLWGNIINEAKVKNHVLRLSGKVSSKLIDTASLYLEATMNIGYSFYDLFAQIINCSILENHFSKRECSFSEVLKELEKKHGLDTICATIKSSSYKKYFFHYMNTTKHRELINTKWSIKSASGIKYNGPVICAFEFDGFPHPNQNLDDVRRLIDESFKELLNFLAYILSDAEARLNSPKRTTP